VSHLVHPLRQLAQIETWAVVFEMLWREDPSSFCPISDDSDLGVLMAPDVGHGEAEVYSRVQV